MSFSSVEDEVLVSSSLSRPYLKNFKKIKEEIDTAKVRKIVLSNSKENPQVKNLKDENEVLEENIRLLKQEKEELAERVSFLNQNIKYLKILF